MDACRLHAKEAGLEQGLRAPEPLIANGDHHTVGKLVALLQAGAGGSGLHLLFEVQSHVAHLLLDVADKIILSMGQETVALDIKHLEHVVRQVTATKVLMDNSMGYGVSLVNGYSIADTMTNMKHKTSCTSRSKQRAHRLGDGIHGWYFEGLEHDLGRLLPVDLGVERGFAQQNGVLLGGNTQFVVEGVMPYLQMASNFNDDKSAGSSYLLHHIPIGNNAIFNGIFEIEHTYVLAADSHIIY